MHCRHHYVSGLSRKVGTNIVLRDCIALARANTGHQGMAFPLPPRITYFKATEEVLPLWTTYILHPVLYDSKSHIDTQAHLFEFNN